MGKLSRRFGDEIELYVRQLAWLHAAPRPEQPGQGFRPIPRIRQYREDGRPLPLPPNPCRYLVEQLLDAGPIMHTGQGRAPLSWHELNEWAAAMPGRFRSWDRRTLHDLSAIYLSELTEAESDCCPPPWWPGEDVDDGDPIEQALERAFSRLDR